MLTDVIAVPAAWRIIQIRFQYQSENSKWQIKKRTWLGLERPLRAQVVQAATKWKRMALKTFDCAIGEGICTDMKAIRKDYFLDHDHSAYVDQWDWEQSMSADQRSLDFLTATVQRIWKVIRGAELYAQEMFPQLKDPRYPDLPDELTFIHAEEILEMYPDLPRKERETRLIQDYPAVFIYGIGWPLADGYPHELRAADYDDWVTETQSKDGRPMHGLNDEIPLSIGGGIGQSRVFMLLLRKAHLGEVSVTLWPPELKKICAERNIHVLQ